MTAYELLLDVQEKKCYTCSHHESCEVLSKGVPCNYKVSKEAAAEIKKVKPFWGLK